VEKPEDVFADVTALKEEFEGDGMFRIWLAPAAGWGASTGLLRATREYADRNDTPVMMHMFETGTDDAISRERNGKSAIRHYEETGLLGPGLLAVHSVAIGEEEIRAYARNQVSVSYNPIANMYLASGVAPVGEMLKAGITVAIGTDGAGSNNDNDMLEAMKFGALLQKTFHKDPLAMTAGGMLRMATIEGARALGMDRITGSVEEGKKADFFLFDPSKSVKSCPVHDIVATLIYSGDHKAVDTVVINGNTVLEDGRFLLADEKEILDDAQLMADDLVRCIQENQG
jgi:5-methylthioadenosine/S-adenosylhomocysteine deaminase